MERKAVKTLKLTKGADVMTVTIFDDGLVKQEIVGSISSVNHGSADAAVLGIARALGGESTRERIGHGHTHAHTHTHGEHTHSH